MTDASSFLVDLELHLGEDESERQCLQSDEIGAVGPAIQYERFGARFCRGDRRAPPTPPPPPPPPPSPRAGAPAPTGNRARGPASSRNPPAESGGPAAFATS